VESAPRTNASYFAKAQRHLARRDPVLKRLIRAIGPCTLRVDPDHFRVLVESIVSQQISTKAADSIFARLEQLLSSTGITPAGLLAQSETALRGVGLSSGKQRALRDLAEKVQSGTVAFAGLASLDDEDVIRHLLPVRGIGRWTAEMFLIFSLGRPDVLPVGDFGFRAGVQATCGLEELPDKQRLLEMAEPWRPYRSIATWYFWRSRGAVPRSE
jgi:DNA-3-methyladenine glycosylase II